MAFRPLKSFFPTADELLHQDLPTLGKVLLAHLKSYEGMDTVYQHAGLNRGYFRAMLENRNVGLGPLPKEPEYRTRQPEVTKRMMEAWNWLERQGLLIHNDQQVADWFTISSDGEKSLDQENLPAPPSPNPARASKSATGAPRAFLSYSWDGPEHQQWVMELAVRLQGESGVEVTFDRWHLNPGDDKAHFMEHAVAENDFVIVVCTPNYGERANKREGGVGYESMVITADLAEHMLTNKFIPVLRKGSWTSSLPIYLKSRMGVDLSDEPYREDEYERLLRVLHGEPLKPPPIGRKPDFVKEARAATAQKAVHEAVVRKKAEEEKAAQKRSGVGRLILAATEAKRMPVAADPAQKQPAKIIGTELRLKKLWIPALVCFGLLVVGIWWAERSHKSDQKSLTSVSSSSSDAPSQTDAGKGNAPSSQPGNGISDQPKPTADATAIKEAEAAPLIPTAAARIWNKKWFVQFSEDSKERACRLGSNKDLEGSTVVECYEPAYGWNHFLVRLGPEDDRTELDRIRKRYLDRGVFSVLLHDEDCSTPLRVVNCAAVSGGRTNQ
jgi:TIR domain